MKPLLSQTPLLALSLALLGVSACRSDPPAPARGAASATTAADPARSPATGDAPPSEAAVDPDDPYAGEAAHVIPFADRTSMGYLLLLPPGPERPTAPTREELRDLVQASFSDRRNDGELDLLYKLIATEPHATDIAFTGELRLPSVDEFADSGPGEGTSQGTAPEPNPEGDAERKELAAKAERERAFDLIGLHIEIVRLGIGEETLIPASVLRDPILTRHLSPEQRTSLLGRQWALLLRADYRNRHGLRGLRLHQTLVRVAAAHYGALIHDPDTLETVDLDAFTARRLRATAGNIADQLAVIPFPDPDDDALLRLGTRGMRRFGAVDLELAGLPRDPDALQRATELLTGLALLLATEGEVDGSGIAVQVPDELEVDCALIKQSYTGHAGESYAPRCEGRAPARVHLVERRPEAHDPRDHVVARVVAPRPRSDSPNYDHPQWVQSTLDTVFGPTVGLSP